jgi:hypothetical protein
MRVALTILFVFLVSFAFHSEARDFTIREKALLINHKNSLKVREYMLGRISIVDLPLSEYLSYKVLKNSCSPLEHLIVKIQDADESFVDQSAKLATLSNVCAQGVIGLSKLYIDHSHE